MGPKTLLFGSLDPYREPSKAIPFHYQAAQLRSFLLWMIGLDFLNFNPRLRGLDAETARTEAGGEAARTGSDLGLGVFVFWVWGLKALVTYSKVLRV